MASKHVTAEEIMNRDVVRLHCDTPLERAVETFEEYAISGAPVVDEAEMLVGVLSASDIVHFESENGAAGGRSTYYHNDPLGDEGDGTARGGEDYDISVLERQRVADWMTPKIISVDPRDSLEKVCSVMTREGVHRVFVVNGKRLHGVISSFDVVKHLASKA